MNSVVYDIQKLIVRLKQADISLDGLCYELDEHRWQEFTKYLQGLTRYQENDFSYMEDCLYMGLRVRKRSQSTSEGEA
jgi:hypothetical protein